MITKKQKKLLAQQLEGFEAEQAAERADTSLPEVSAAAMDVAKKRHKIRVSAARKVAKAGGLTDEEALILFPHLSADLGA